MKLQILKTLMEKQGEWISGEELSHLAGVTRSCIWKHVRTLKAEGYVIESVPSKGYKLMNTVDALTREELIIQLEESKIISDVIHLKTVESTNRYARDLDKSNLLILAEQQTGGRGRLGRTWISPDGQGIWMTLSLKPQMDPSEASLITQIAAASVWEAIKEITELKASIKWPNDILLDGKKTCGILTEMQAELGAIEKLMVGIGLNVNIESFPPELETIATSLQLKTGRKWSRKELILSIIRHFEKYYLHYEQTDDVSEVIALCKNNSALIGKPIRIISGSKEEHAVALDLGPAGELIVKRENGEIASIISGEISVRENTLR